jgi:hypothetical protein
MKLFGRMLKEFPKISPFDPAGEPAVTTHHPCQENADRNEPCSQEDKKHRDCACAGHDFPSPFINSNIPDTDYRNLNNKQ